MDGQTNILTDERKDENYILLSINAGGINIYRQVWMVDCHLPGCGGFTEYFLVIWPRTTLAFLHLKTVPTVILSMWGVRGICNQKVAFSHVMRAEFEPLQIQRRDTKWWEVRNCNHSAMEVTGELFFTHHILTTNSQPVATTTSSTDTPSAISVSTKPFSSSTSNTHWNRTIHMSRLMTKPTKWMCAQRRLGSAWASAQFDQSLRCALNG